MAEQKSAPAVRKFAGIEVPPDLTQGNFFFLYFNTLLVGLLMVIPAILQPAFLKDIIRVSVYQGQHSFMMRSCPLTISEQERHSC